eukprot:CAMPEP_0180375582 /NCGR_PEP_ID=MMETSP0989-20121125/22784_1 /TAXON_ID=697907 /ORGANISM="non described non described, Strain CCMP2293" /LENGTH=144 /DNA_ID=CAMNT_0022373391 /DNA_START=417 /DNA_END=852 /DNA_ORIENTATION=-
MERSCETVEALRLVLAVAGETVAEILGSWETEAAPRLWSAAMVGAWWSAALVDAWSGMVVVWSTETSFKGKPKRRQAERKARRALRSGRDAGKDDGIRSWKAGAVLKARSAVTDGAAMGSALVGKDERGRCGGVLEFVREWRGA